MTRQQQHELREHAHVLGSAIARHVFNGGGYVPAFARILIYCRSWLKPRCGYRRPLFVPFEKVAERVAGFYGDLDFLGVSYE